LEADATPFNPTGGERRPSDRIFIAARDITLALFITDEERGRFQSGTMSAVGVGEHIVRIPLSGAAMISEKTAAASWRRLTGSACLAKTE
jgi:hypothetical protein